MGFITLFLKPVVECGLKNESIRDFGQQRLEEFEKAFDPARANESERFSRILSHLLFVSVAKALIEYAWLFFRHEVSRSLESLKKKFAKSWEGYPKGPESYILFYSTLILTNNPVHLWLETIFTELLQLVGVPDEEVTDRIFRLEYITRKHFINLISVYRQKNGYKSFLEAFLNEANSQKIYEEYFKQRYYEEDIYSNIDRPNSYDPTGPTLRQVYVAPLAAVLLINKDFKLQGTKIIDLTKHIINVYLQPDSSPSRMIIVTGTAGLGKTSWTHVLAETVGGRYYGKGFSWYPIRIDVKNLTSLQKVNSTELKNSLKFILQDAIRGEHDEEEFGKWFSPQAGANFLVILDGLDELAFTDQLTATDFIEACAKYQQANYQCIRFIITSRPLKLLGLEDYPLLQNKIEWIRLCGLDEPEPCEPEPYEPLILSSFPSHSTQRFKSKYPRLQRWLIQWERYLKDNQCWDKERENSFSSVENFTTGLIDLKREHPLRDFIKEPLLLYLLASFARDNSQRAITLLNILGKQQGQESLKHKAFLYKTVLDDAFNKHFSKQHTFRSIGDLRSFAQWLACVIVQSGNRSVEVSQLRKFFYEQEDINSTLLSFENPSWCEQMRERQWFNEKRDYKTNVPESPLIEFYWHVDRSGRVEFSHKSFGEYLFAELIYKRLLLWGNLSKERVWEEIFILLSVFNEQALWPQFLIGLIQGSEHSDALQKSSKALIEFENLWRSEYFINALDTNLIQKQLRRLKSHLDFNQENQIDGQPNNKLPGVLAINFNSGRLCVLLLLAIAQKIDSIGYIFNFPRGENEAWLLEKDWKSIIQHAISELNLSFKNANFKEASLPGFNFEGGNLKMANFEGANLERAIFVGADLFAANLSNCNLESSNFHNADLENAKLIKSSIQSGNFHKANLSGVAMQECDLAWARLTEVRFLATNFKNTNLMKVQFDNTSLKNCYLDGAIISRDYWYIISESLGNHYFLDSHEEIQDIKVGVLRKKA